MARKKYPVCGLLYFTGNRVFKQFANCVITILMEQRQLPAKCKKIFRSEWHFYPFESSAF